MEVEQTIPTTENDVNETVNTETDTENEEVTNPLSSAITALSQKLKAEKNARKKIEDELSALKNENKPKGKSFDIPEEYKVMLDEYNSNRVKTITDKLMKDGFSGNTIKDFLVNNPDCIKDPKKFETKFITENYTKLISNSKPQLDVNGAAAKTTSTDTFDKQQIQNIAEIAKLAGVDKETIEAYQKKHK